jgi:hypothetical protein
LESKKSALIIIILFLCIPNHETADLEIGQDLNKGHSKDNEAQNTLGSQLKVSNYPEESYDNYSVDNTSLVAPDLEHLIFDSMRRVLYIFYTGTQGISIYDVDNDSYSFWNRTEFRKIRNVDFDEESNQLFLATEYAAVIANCTDHAVYNITTADELPERSAYGIRGIKYDNFNDILYLAFHEDHNLEFFGFWNFSDNSFQGYSKLDMSVTINQIWQIELDKSHTTVFLGNNWGDGVGVFNTTTEEFSILPSTESIYDSYKLRYIPSLHSLAIMTFGYGMWIANLTDGSVAKLLGVHSNPNAFCYDPDADHYYIGTWRGGFYIYNRTSGDYIIKGPSTGWDGVTGVEYDPILGKIFVNARGPEIGGGLVTFDLIFDRITPEINLISPGNNTRHPSGTEIYIEILDPHITHVKYNWDDQSNVTLVEPYNVTLPSGNGFHKLNVYALDLSGNENNTNFLFITDDPPNIWILTPTNETLTTSNVWLNFTIDTTTVWIGYSLDYHDNVTIAGNVSLNSIAEGVHHIVIYSNNTFGKMGKSIRIWFTVDLTPPQIFITSPLNKSYSEQRIRLNFTVDESTSWIGYSLDGNDNITITGNSSLYSLPDGSYSIVIYTNDTAGNMGISETVWFTIDSGEPYITITSPLNTTYTEQSIWLNFTIDEVTSWIGYSIDDNQNVTISGNIMWSSLSKGSHFIVIYANDTERNMGQSITIWFTISFDDVPPEIGIYGLENNTEYSGSFLITVTITDESALKSAAVWITNGREYQNFSSKYNLTLVNVTAGSWTVSILIDTSLYSNGQYEVGIQICDVFQNEIILLYTITIANQQSTTSITTSSSSATTASTIIMSPTTSTTASSAATSTIKPPSEISPGFSLTLLAMIPLFILVLRRRKKNL